jgi:hypothetical protein
MTSTLQKQLLKFQEENRLLLEELKKLQNTKNDIENTSNQLITDNSILAKENKKLKKLLETDKETSTSVIQHDQELIQLKKYLIDNQIDIKTLTKQLKQRFYWQLVLTVKLLVESSHTVHIWANCTFYNRQFYCIINDK